MMLAQSEFLCDLMNLMEQRDEFYPKNNENTNALIEKFKDKYQNQKTKKFNEKINNFSDLQDILSVELRILNGLNELNREHQAKVINFIIGNLCGENIISKKSKKDIVKYQEQIYDLTKELRKKFKTLEVITILEELNEKVLKTNKKLLNYSERMIQELNKIIPNNNNPNKDKNLNPTSQKYENNKVQNSTTKSVYERININQSKQNQTGPAPQIKSPANLGKEY